jgi:hypothetical protein
MIIKATFFAVIKNTKSKLHTHTLALVLISYVSM